MKLQDFCFEVNTNSFGRSHRDQPSRGEVGASSHPLFAELLANETMGEFDFWPVSKSVVVGRIDRRALRRPSEEAGAVEVFGGGRLEGRKGQRTDGWMGWRNLPCLFAYFRGIETGCRLS